MKYCLNILTIIGLLLLSYAAKGSTRSTYEVDKNVSIKIFYRWNDVASDSVYLDNKSALLQIDEFFSSRDRIIDSLYIVSSASPEGNVRMNAALSERRGETLRKIILNRYSKDKFVRGGVVALGSNFPEFLDSLQADSDVPHREEIIGLIREGKDKDAAFRKVMALYDGKPYEYICEHILPYLRYAKVIIFFHDRIEAPQGPMPQFHSLAATAISPMPELSKCEPVRVETAAAPEEKKERKYWYPALKTNLLYDAVTAVNAEVEFPIGRKFSIAVEDVFPWWSWGPNDKKYCFQLWSMGVEPRWWFRRTDKKDYLSGHFLGVYGMGAKYDIQNDTKLCYQGEYWSAGISYGYAMPVCSWLNMEFAVSAGFLQSDYRHYQPDPSYEHLYKDKFKVGKVSWFGPTKLKVSLVVPIGKDSHGRRR